VAQSHDAICSTVTFTADSSGAGRRLPTADT
jgi:hypothetical protein